jgi:thiamine biosynthesis lipoprotein
MRTFAMPVNRRKFLTLSVGGAASLVLGHAASRRRGAANAVTRRSWALGSDVSMTILGASTERAERALDAAFAELETVERVMSLYRHDSQLCRLNLERVVYQPHPYLVEVLLAAGEMSRRSEGAFDVTVQPLWELYAESKRRGELPADEEIAAARQLVNWRALSVKRDRIWIRTPARAITLNGIAQGFAADRAVAALRQHGIEHALVNSGEVGCLGRKPDGDDWTVGVQHPRVADAYVSLAKLDGRSLATSGDYETKFTGDFSKNHIFDPRTERTRQCEHTRSNSHAGRCS